MGVGEKILGKKSLLLILLEKKCLFSNLPEFFFSQIPENVCELMSLVICIRNLKIKCFAAWMPWKNVFCHAQCCDKKINDSQTRKKMLH